MNKLLFGIMAWLCCFQAQAAVKKEVSMDALRDMAAKWEAQQAAKGSWANWKFSVHGEDENDRCDRGSNQGSCVAELCKNDAYGCRYNSDVEKYAKVCRGVNGKCLQALCEKDSYKCKYFSDVEKIAAQCKGVDGGCVKVGCEYDSYKCAYSSDRERITSVCKGWVDEGCIEALCKNTTCNYTSDFERVVKACKGE